MFVSHFLMRYQQPLPATTPHVNLRNPTHSLWAQPGWAGLSRRGARCGAGEDVKREESNGVETLNIADTVQAVRGRVTRKHTPTPPHTVVLMRDSACRRSWWSWWIILISINISAGDWWVGTGEDLTILHLLHFLQRFFNRRKLMFQFLNIY